MTSCKVPGLGRSGAVPSQSHAPNPQEEARFEFKTAFPFLHNSPRSKFLPSAELDLPSGAPGTHELLSPPHCPSEIGSCFGSTLNLLFLARPRSYRRLILEPRVLQSSRPSLSRSLSEGPGPRVLVSQLRPEGRHPPRGRPLAVTLSRSGYMICGPSAK